MSGSATVRSCVSSTNSQESGCSRPPGASGAASEGVVSIPSQQLVAQCDRILAAQAVDLELPDLRAGREHLELRDAEAARDRALVDVGVLDARARHEGLALPQHAAPD